MGHGTSLTPKKKGKKGKDIQKKPLSPTFIQGREKKEKVCGDANEDKNRISKRKEKQENRLDNSNSENIRNA